MNVNMFARKGLQALAKEGKEKNKRRDEDQPELPWNVERFVPDAERFKALGDPTRLAVISFLMSREFMLPVKDDDGASVTEIACALTGKSGKEPSTLSHHLKELRHAGLVTQTRHGKNICYRAEVDVVDALCGKIYCRQGKEETALVAETQVQE